METAKWRVLSVISPRVTNERIPKMMEDEVVENLKT